ncbi:MAG: DsbA family protein [Rhodospirillales bacterium]|nr:DsbA family protein [Rhodospirillales bacterium]MCB9964913.1 DsbA family protein [Rhodospirillales bacterium]MCB9979989.1 DsbA family protein [Rhodospirillales bacterium]
MNSFGKIVIFLVLLGLIGGGVFFYKNTPLKQHAEIPASPAMETENGSTDEPSPDEDITSDASQTANSEDSAAQTDQAKEAVSSAPESTYDLGERSIGAADAPITMVEFSSLSCGHCGAFHKDVLPKIKESYIDTGKVRLVIIDFPLNLPALQGAMLAHCLPEDQYFNFLQLLFATQDVWLNGDYLAKLKQNAQLAGLSPDDVQTCLDNKSLEDAIISRMGEAQTKWGITSTPSFIFNEGVEKVTGNAPLEEFEKTIGRVLMEAPAAAPDSADSPPQE